MWIKEVWRVVDKFVDWEVREEKMVWNVGWKLEVDVICDGVCVVMDAWIGDGEGTVRE